ncbi:hypothetical protein HNY73_009670 [Argiope bruennichi]|uniref:Uncharacterized protein n=1 Tax=Argiope bruennichi TaxID=94029 RepID=A0A8T0FAC9_ARGBR|nr:hypothetical protein HNY73_009670 [Argiope bruennichi]
MEWNWCRRKMMTNREPDSTTIVIFLSNGFLSWVLTYISSLSGVPRQPTIVWAQITNQDNPELGKLVFFMAPLKLWNDNFFLVAKFIIQN